MNADERRLADLTLGEAKRAGVYALLTCAAASLLALLLGRLCIALLLGVVAAVYLLPVQHWFTQRLRVREGSALVTIALIVLPLVALTLYVAHELSNYTNLVQERRPELVQTLGNALAQYLPLTRATTRAAIEAAFAGAMSNGVALGQALRQQTPLLLASMTLFFFTVFYVLTQSARLAAYIKLRIPGDFLPLYERLAANVGGALSGVLRAVFVDQTIKAFVILTLNLIFGVPLAVALATLTFLIGFFPLLGEWAIYIPVSVFLLVFQHAPISAALYLGTGVCLTISSSLLLRPKLASAGNRQFNFYWMLVALVAGVFSFGIPGIVLGPVILGFVKALSETLLGNVKPATSLLFTEIQLEQSRAETLPNPPSPPAPPSVK